MVKYHFVVESGLACGRQGKVITDRVGKVTCLNCQKSPEFIEAKAEVDAQLHAAFLAQTPREYREPWGEGVIRCSECGGQEFRMGNRTCYGHYQNYHCGACGHVESRLTETGMSF
jgi:hypothetical protein